MHWLIKASIQRLASLLPKSNEINYFLQRKVSKSLPVSDEVFMERLGYAKARIDLFSQYSSVPLRDCVAFEFGAGWDLEGPLAFAAMGIRQQQIVDITRGARPELISSVIEQFRRLPIQQVLGKDAELPKGGPLRSLGELDSSFGINYDAPADARRTSLRADSIDLISTNSTLEHIPPESLRDILKECRRILKPEGVMVHFIDMKDHYSHFDKSITPYNFLTLSPLVWRFVNSPLQYQNRLRKRDYMKMFVEAGFKVVHEWTEEPTPAEAHQLQALRLNPAFRDYSPADIGAQILRVVLRK